MSLHPTRCAVPGCHLRGIYSKHNDGRGPWYCRRHERAREAQSVTRARIQADLLFFAPTKEPESNE